MADHRNRRAWRDRLPLKISSKRTRTGPKVNRPLSSAPQIVASKPAPPPPTQQPPAVAKPPTARKQSNKERIVLGPCTLTLPNGQTYRTVGETIITITKEPRK